MVKRKKSKPITPWSPDGKNWYLRIGGKYVRINAPHGTAEFDAECWEILSGKRAETRRGWSALIKMFREDKVSRWAQFSARYRADLEPVFAYIEDKLGKRDVAKLTQADICDAMDANAHRIRFANYLPTAFSMLCQYAVRKRWRLDNPALGIKPLSMPKTKQKPHIPWPDWAVDKFRLEAADLPRLAFEIGVGSVQRPGDWVDFRWSDYDGDILFLRQNKTDVPLYLPCTDHLKAALDAAKASLGVLPHPTRPILTKPDGSPMSYRYLAQIMLDERKRLGLEAYDLHALRYRGVKELAWVDCTDEEIASYSGHTSMAMIRKYAGEARQIMRAKRAREKRR